MASHRAGANGEGFETSERELREIHMPPFEAAVKVAGAACRSCRRTIRWTACRAMRTIGCWRTCCAGNRGFTGFVTSDMGDIPNFGTGGGYGGYRFVRDDAASAVASLNAGVDMELIGNLYMKDLPAAIGDGRVTMQTVERAAKRVLEAKLRLLGLGAPAAGAPEAAAGEGGKAEETIRGYQGKDDIWAKLIAEGKFDTAESGRRPDWQGVVKDPAHDALALELAEKAVVLLKNDGGLLPLDRAKTRKLLVTGPLAVIPNIGGYSTGKPKFFHHHHRRAQCHRRRHGDRGVRAGVRGFAGTKMGKQAEGRGKPGGHQGARRAAHGRCRGGRRFRRCRSSLMSGTRAASLARTSTAMTSACPAASRNWSRRCTPPASRSS